MYPYRTPGVRFEWLDPPPGIGDRRTDIAGFVGIAARGPLHEPVKVESWTQFTSTFGAHIAQAYLAYAVEGFLLNGGRTCWVVRVADPRAVRPASLELLDDYGTPVLRLMARTKGTWGHDIVVSLARTAADRFSLTLQTSDGGIELWRNLSMDPGDAQRYVVPLLNDVGAGSRLVGAEDLSAVVGLAPTMPSDRASNLRHGVGRLTGGSDGLATLGPEHFSGDGAPENVRWGLAALELVDEVSIVALPDVMTKPRVQERRPRRRLRCDAVDGEAPQPPLPDEPADFPPPFTDLDLEMLQTAVVRHCERLQDRVAVLDPRLGDTTPALAAAWRQAVDSAYAALYWPWLRCPDPLRLEGLVRAVPPSGHVAGIYARGDLRVGVHKPPANELLEGVSDVVAATDDVAHGDLNSLGINVIRVWNGQGIRVAGARTLSRDPLCRYVNVRRLLNMIEEGICEDTPWTVFEPNGPELWRQVDGAVRGLLDRLWRRGMLDGASAADAYFVTCDETTNPPAEVDAGRVICLIGIQPPLPAEFVIVRIGRTADSVEIIETAGVPSG
jgi:hypothetical protein